MSWLGPARGDVFEIAAEWQGPRVHGQPDGTWLTVSAGEFVTVIDLAHDGNLYCSTRSGAKGWLGGPGCLARVTLEFAVGPQDRVVTAPVRGLVPAQKRPRVAAPPAPAHSAHAPPPPPATPHPLLGRAAGGLQPVIAGGLPSEQEVMQLIEQRNQARKSGDFRTADRVRDTLKARGVALMDEKGASGHGVEVTNWRYWNADQEQQHQQQHQQQQPPPPIAPHPLMHGLGHQFQPPPPAVPPPAALLQGSGTPSEHEITHLIEERNMARKANDFQRADAIRDSLKQRGIMLQDEKNVRGDHSGQEVTTWRHWDPNASARQPAPPPQHLDNAPPPPPGPHPHAARLSQHEVLQAIEERNVARKAGDYARSDAIRADLQARGVVLMDEKGQLATTWRYWDDAGAPPRN